MKHPSARCAAISLALLAWSCDRDLSRDYSFIVRVSSEPGRAVEGARASLGGRELGVSDGSGSLTLQVRGHEGDVVPVEISCPSGHRAPPRVLVPLRRIGHDVLPEFAAICTPLSHSLVVAVLAEQGANLPVSYLGREIARTDASGAAHALLDVASEDVVELALDTSEQPELRPKSPVLRIQPGAGDTIIPIRQDFTVQPLARPRKVEKPRGPIRIR